VFSVYDSAMSDEWRVSLALGGRTGVPKKLVEDLRVRLGDDIGVSADKAHRYLYAGTEKAADEAGQVAREALTLDGRVADSSVLERWDPDGQKWRDPRAETADDKASENPANMIEFVRDNPSCIDFTDGCSVCTVADGNIVCSAPRIQCQVKALTCSRKIGF